MQKKLFPMYSVLNKSSIFFTLILNKDMQKHPNYTTGDNGNFI